MIKAMQKKNNSLMYSITVFAFLYSGTVIYSPFYASGNAVLSFVLTSVITLAYTAFASRYFARRNGLKLKLQAKFFAVAVSVLAIVPMGALAADYTRTLATFADYYATAFVSVFSAAAVILIAVYCASREKSSVMGLATLVFSVLVLWTLAGLFAFMTTKNIVPLQPPFSKIAQTDWFVFVKNAVYVCIDITLLTAVLCNNEQDAVRKTAPRAINRGAAAFVILSGINTFKNLLLFGDDFASRLDNPDLAAIRLIPMVDLPEMSVIVNTFACVLKLAVYSCLIFTVTKDAFGDAYRNTPVISAVSSAVFAVWGFMFYFAEEKMALSGISPACLTFCVLLCYVFFSLPVKRQKQTKNDDGM